MHSMYYFNQALIKLRWLPFYLCVDKYGLPLLNTTDHHRFTYQAWQEAGRQKTNVSTSDMHNK